LAEKNISSPGAEGKQGVLQKTKYIVHAGCAEANLMTLFLIPIEESFWLSGSN